MASWRCKIAIGPGVLLATARLAGGCSPAPTPPPQPHGLWAPGVAVEAETTVSLSGACPVTRSANTNESALPLGIPCELPARGLHETGAALADIDGDGLADLITSSGNDNAAQRLATYHYRSGVGFAGPIWSPGDVKDANMRLAVGDVDGDDRLDVCVAALDQDFRGHGGVKLYQGASNGLVPKYRTHERFRAFDCAFGDYDADGRLDLAASFMVEGGVAPPPSTPYPGLGVAHARIYAQVEGRLETTPRWTSLRAVQGGGIAFSDLDDDGFLDLVQGGDELLVFWGERTNDGRVALNPTPAIFSPGPWIPSVAVAVAADGVRTIAVARNGSAGLVRNKAPSARAEIHRVRGRTLELQWALASPGHGSDVTLAYIDADRTLDLVVSAWGDQGLEGAALEMYRGNANGSMAKSFPDGEWSYRGVGQQIALADIDNTRSTSVVWEKRVDSGPRAVITVPDPMVARIEGVEVNGVALERGAFAWVPYQSWISFRGLLGRDPNRPDRVQVRYTRTTRVDFAVANQDAAVGVHLYFNQR